MITLEQLYQNFWFALSLYCEEKKIDLDKDRCKINESHGKSYIICWDYPYPKPGDLELMKYEIEEILERRKVYERHEACQKELSLYYDSDSEELFINIMGKLRKIDLQ